jgi:CHASE2 domain-containing sensor protein
MPIERLRDAYKHLRRGIPVVLAVSVGVLFLEWAGFFRTLQDLALITFQVLDTGHTESAITIVEISDGLFDDKNFAFKGQYPLAAGGVKDIIVAIAKGKPKVIGIDLNTAQWLGSDLDDLKRRLTELQNQAPLIWARDMVSVGGSRQYCAGSTAGNNGLYDRYTGIAAVPADWDGVVRRYHRVLPVLGLCSDASEREMIQSFPWAVATLVEQGVPAEKVRAPDATELVLNFYGDRFNFRPLPAEAALKQADEPGWAVDGAVTGRIALIGGSYHAAHDVQVTPVGIRSGAQIVAQAIQSELSGRGVHPFDAVRMTLVEAFLGFLLIGVHTLLSGIKALIATGVLFLGIAFGGSELTYSSYAQWVDCIPMLIAVVFHEFYHQAKTDRKELNLLRKAQHSPQALGAKGQDRRPESEAPSMH